MNTSPTFQIATRWNARDLANAVPLRLSELFAFDACVHGTGLDRVAHEVPRRSLRGGYLRNSDLPPGIRVHS